MTVLIVFICLIVLSIVVVQIGRISELAANIRGEEDVIRQSNSTQSKLLLLFGAGFLIAMIAISVYYKNYMLGYGPHESATAHGGQLDDLFNITLIVTSIVFFITQIALFYFSWKYRARKGSRAAFISHDDTLEIVWTAVPAIVMALLVLKGLVAWNDVMADVGPDEEVMEIEAMGQQFAWLIRYPGPDGKLGERSYKTISSTNPFGQNWEDKANHDDFHPNELYFPVNKKVRVRITAKDVLHNFDIPHFRVKMDALPGMPTYFVFTPTITTEEYRQRLKEYPEYHELEDPSDPSSPKMWEAFDYELACAELCGKGHYSMRKVVKVVTQEEYDAWLLDKASWYDSQIKGKVGLDPFVDAEKAKWEERSTNFMKSFEEVMESDAKDKVLRLEFVNFETGSSKLTQDSKYQLDDLVSIMKTKDDFKVEIGGHTDNTGNEDSNLKLSEDRAVIVKEYLVGEGIAGDRIQAKGYGQLLPVASNDTEEGKAQNRRTEFKIIK